MEENKTFTITFTKLNGESVTRRGKWTDLKGNLCHNFWDIDAEHPRTMVNGKVSKA